MQMADGLLMVAARATSKMEAESAAARARTPPNQNPRPVSRAVMLAAGGAKRGAGAVAYVADRVLLARKSSTTTFAGSNPCSSHDTGPKRHMACRLSDYSPAPCV